MEANCIRLRRSTGWAQAVNGRWLEVELAALFLATLLMLATAIPAVWQALAGLF